MIRPDGALCKAGIEAATHILAGGVSIGPLPLTPEPDAAILYIHPQYRHERRYGTVPKTAVISARIDPELKHDAEDVFRELGLTATQAITLFYRQVELEQGLPFAVRLPNDETKEALEQARTRQGLESFNTLEDLLKDLGI